jgi:DNA topoisomerase-1
MDSPASPAAPVPAPENVQAARAARLRYINDRRPGITREGVSGGFLYRDPRGARITDPAELARIKALAIPPAWSEVWICPQENGHLQATGRDARRRKQFRYHPRWRRIRDETKYEHMLDFGRSLPAIRRRVEADLGRPGLPREKVLAAVVRLLEDTLARVGNPEYAAQNRTFGLTTLRNRHVRITRGQIELDFRAKHGIRHVSRVSDRKLARVVKNCRDLPGSELFQYIDEAGERHCIDSADVNDYLREISGRDITAKDFRTWAATNLAILALAAREEEKPTRKGQIEAIRQVARRLGNTPAICRKCYIHPAVLEGYLNGDLRRMLAAVGEVEEIAEVWRIERTVMRFLSQRPAAGAVTHIRREPHRRRRSGGAEDSRRARCHARSRKEKERACRQSDGRSARPRAGEW